MATRIDAEKLMNKILFTAINILIVIAVIFFLDLPKYNAFKELNSKIDIKKTEIQTQENYFKNIEQVSQEISSFPEEVAKVNSALPDTFLVHSLINLLQENSSTSGLILKKIDFSQPSVLQENQNISSLPISLEVAGNYPAFKNFLSSLEKSARLIEVENIAFSYPAKETKQGYTFSLGLRVYSY